MQGTPFLVLDTRNDSKKLTIEYLADDFEERDLNGESIYHVYHVRMLTEFLLRELCTYKPELSMPEEDIAAIAMASALHDIGKLQIPKSILDYPGTLSPLEYDIIKKHSVFGEQIIRAANEGDIPQKTIEYAALIARSHHERIDGTGYPEGLRGDAIPLCAQVVALADSYDALTSSRRYKEAFSQDVALQMISSGMCGVFDAGLVECLMHVVNHRTLVTFRENLQKKRSVVGEYSDIRLKRVLLIGNTEYLTEEFVNTTFPQSKVMVVGNTDLRGSDRIKLFRVRKPSVKSILETYEFDLIVFFSAGLKFQSTDQNDAEELREVLQFSAELQKGIKILYLSPLDSSFSERTDKAIMASANEKLCEFYAKRYSLDIKTVQIPYLYSATYKNDFLYRVFEQIYSGKTVCIPESSTAKMHFLSLPDLSDLLIRIVDNWKAGSGVLSVGDEFHLTFSDFAERLETIAPNVKTEFTKSHVSGVIKTTNTALRNEYGWFAKVSVLEDLEDQYALYLGTKKDETETFGSAIKKWLAKHSFVIRIIELFLLFFLSELFIHITDSAVIFSIVDFRTIFIVMMATLYGLSFGIASSALASISYFIAKVMAGTDPLTIFYEPTNWLAFVFFFLVGGLCGYVNLKKEEHSKYLKEQNRLLEDKLTFMGEIYEDTLREKKDLKKQIISSKDSFGKIFDITRKLNTVAPQQLYLRTIETFEEILENKSISVYSVNAKNAFGRLEVASRDLLDIAARSVSLQTYAPVIEKLRDGGIWRNTELKSEYPMYAAGVYRGDELVLMIFLWHADMGQRSLYYVNLFKILRDLVQMSLLRAYDYGNALAEKQYISGTHIMNAEYFEECVQNFAALAEKKVSTYVMLEFGLNGHTLKEANDMITGKIRLNDILGMTNDGKLRLILSQASEKDIEFVLPRFEGLDITVTVVK
ncbi:MAG: HD domain-containing protein [Ruminococcaceae bacterium]|nr:HD domain-containing protein [Oscillospiraceae bacterium]